MNDIRFLPKSEEIKLDKNLQKLINNHSATFEYECAYCGKKFDIYPCRLDKWTYKRKNKKLLLFCSYTCMVQDEKEDF